MATRTINLSKAAEHYRKLGKKFWPAVLVGARLAGERSRAMLVERSQALAFNTGAYARGWKWLVFRRSLIVYNQAPYAGVIEMGRRPDRKQPPIDAILPWVKRKLRVTHVVTRGKRKGESVKRPLPDAEARSVAFLVARKIARDGIPGKLIMTRARGAIIRFVMEEVTASLERMMETTDV